MTRLAAIDTLLAELGRRIFTSTGHTVPLRYRAAGHDDRAEVLVEDRTTWRPVTPDLVWGEPDGYFWFAGGLTIPDSLSGAALHLRIAAFAKCNRMACLQGWSQGGGAARSVDRYQLPCGAGQRMAVRHGHAGR